MADVFDTIQSTVKIQSAHYPLPFFARGAVSLFQTAHLLHWQVKDYTHIRQAQATPEQGNPLVYAGAATLLAEYSSSVDFILNLIVVTNYTADILHQHRLVYKSSQKLYHDTKVSYPCYYQCDWQKLGSPLLPLSPSLHLKIYLGAVKYLRVASKFCHRAVDFTKKAFHLAMREADLYLVTTGDKLARFRATKEIIANQSDFQKNFSDDFDALLDSVKQNEDVVNSILQSKGFKITTSEIIATIENWRTEALEKIKQVGKTGKEVVQPIFEAGKIKPITLDLEPEAAPTIAPARFVPWAGQKTANMEQLLEEEEDHELMMSKKTANERPSGQSLSDVVRKKADQASDSVRKFMTLSSPLE
ncbi:MAG: hypothetical protein H0W88_06190 [Parachlamydiaceae bacterium]|nr:hypothetical protein [Parachlamydiaceae bacterium]